MIQVLTDHMNLCIFFLGKTLKPQEARWWEQFSGLDLAIEHQEGKKNPANSLSRRPNYYRDKTDDTDETYQILGYITQSLVKAQRKAIESVWRAAGKESQAPQGTKAKSGPNQAPVSQLAISKPRSSVLGAPKPAQSSAQNAKEESNVPKVFTPNNTSTRPKRKRNRKKNSSERAAKKHKTRNIESIQEKTLKLIRLHFLNDANPEARVNPEDVKKIFEKKSIFGALSLELRTVLEILQESDSLAQEKWP